MPTPSESKALLFFAGVLVLGSAVRIVESRGRLPADSPQAKLALEQQIRRVDAARSNRGRKKARQSAAGRRVGRPATAPAAVDMDTASEEQIESLTGIGRTLAKRIVVDRDSFGPFGSPEGLTRVRGVGPALARKLAPSVTFSRLPRPENAVSGPRRQRPARGRKAAATAAVFP